MWEVMSRSLHLPYPDVVRNEDVKDHIMAGYRPGKSESTPEPVYVHVLLNELHLICLFHDLRQGQIKNKETIYCNSALSLFVMIMDCYEIELTL